MIASRREVLRAFLGTSVATVAGCRRSWWLPDIAGGFVDPNFVCGHQLRNPRFDGEFVERQARVIVLGAGISGLSAVRRLSLGGCRDVALLELEALAGGTAAGGASGLSGYPWGAHYLPAPSKENAELVSLLDEMGELAGVDDHGEPIFREGIRCAVPQERVYAGRYWQSGLVPKFGVPLGGEEAVSGFLTKVRAFASERGEDGRHGFALPLRKSSEDPRFLRLDQMSFADWLSREEFHHPVVRWFAGYATRDDFGARPEETSAWYGLHYYAARIPYPGASSRPFLTWPAGNHTLVKYLSENYTDSSKVGGRGATYLGNRLVTRVKPHTTILGDVDSSRLCVEVNTSHGRERWLAERVIYALPSFLKPHILAPELEVDGASLETSAWMVANIHLWRRPRGQGVETAWDNVIYSSRSLGYVVATHQLGPHSGPTIWTWYLPIVGSSVQRIRRELMALDWITAADLVLSDLEVAHPDIRHCVERIDIRRWGHAMAIPAPGTRTNSRLMRSSNPRGRLHFAHSDLSGVGLFEEAFDHGLRAAEEVLHALRNE